MQINKNTNFLLKFRKFEKKDINYSCHHAPDEESFEMHLNTTIRDIENIEGVVSSTKTKHDQVIVIEVEANFDENKLKEDLAVYLKREQCHIKLISFKRDVSSGQ